MQPAPPRQPAERLIELYHIWMKAALTAEKHHFTKIEG
jgi:hypothetical protein